MLVYHFLLHIQLLDSQVHTKRLTQSTIDITKGYWFQHDEKNLLCKWKIPLSFDL
ncbi:hypothetical protein FRX31_028092, partial [Thalictrum thalictroides]